MWNTYLLGGTPGLEHLILEWNVSVPPEGGANPPLKRFYTSPGEETCGHRGEPHLPDCKDPNPGCCSARNCSQPRKKS
jgi:hypothetical protein